MLSTAAAADAPEVQSKVNRAVGQALDGDAAAAARTLADIPAAQVTGENAELRACVVKTFGAGSKPAKLADTGDAWVDSVASAYQDYWHYSLTHPKNVAGTEKTLRARISAALGRPIKSDADFDSAEADLEKKASEHGFHVLLGRTPPLRELMLWRKTTVDMRTAPLPGGPEVVKVNLLDDFVLRGWAYYATCTQRSAGGWTTDDALFAVVPAYRSITDETFNVRFVAHEGQHFADKRVFKDLAAWELEYRGKLAEFALSDESFPATLQLICESQGDSRDNPHPYANAQIVRSLSARLGSDATAFCAGTLARPAIREAARSLLLADTARRQVAAHAAADPLFAKILALDTAAFDAFNTCGQPGQLDKYASYFAKDVEFFHDKGGVTWTRDAMIEQTRANVCDKFRRELVPESFRVWPIAGYGAMEQGSHRFCHTPTTCEGTGEFTIVWHEDKGVWTITRALSYAHN